MPNFLVIGTQKATTSLHHYLKQHPEVYLNYKDARFFAVEGREPGSFQGPGDQELMSRKTVIDIEGYRALFSGVSDEKAVGETSPIYLYVPGAADRIKHYVPEARLIAVLRNPVERAYSAYLTLVRSAREPLGFSEALKEEETRIQNNWHPIWHYKRRGFYHAQLARYFELFDPAQIRVYLHEELDEDPVGTTQSIFRFLEVDDAFVPDTSLKYDDVSGIPKSRALHALIKRPNSLKPVVRSFLPEGLRRRIAVNVLDRNLAKAPPMAEDVREELTEAYREDVLELQGLIGRDLSGWLGKEA